ncbi:MAG: G5 domain-containing protein [Anaerolineales bacterium]|nr:G5 domain-containing protein [Anaerolineales bacterium]
MGIIPARSGIALGMMPPHASLRLTSLWMFLALGLAGCAAPITTAGDLNVTIIADGEELAARVPAGSTALQALETAGVNLGASDRLEPPAYAVLSDGTHIMVTRVNERFEVETEVVPFERQTIRNEAMPEGESRLLQPGMNGLQEITYRVVEEEGKPASRTAVKVVVAEAPVPEIVMIGAQLSYAPLSVEGVLAYLSGGNAWIIRDDTRNRRPIVVGENLDGRVFRLSPDGRWLLFSQAPADPSSAEINRLWIVSTSEAATEPIDLQVSNIVHFADWSPQAIDGYTLAYSTVEPSPGAPGWQANNDLWLLTLTFAGRVADREQIVESNAGGQYGWWGTSFAWAPDGSQLAYARADGIGRVPLDEPGLLPLVEIQPYQSFSDWAWVPGVAWGGDNQSLYFVDHAPPQGLESPASSPAFDLSAWIGDSATAVPLIGQAGMFSYPAVSPAQIEAGGELAYRIAYLQALAPLESQNSSYQLSIVDRDGSNASLLFPPPGEAGLTPRPLAWSPSADRVAVLYRGDLWIVDAQTGQGQRLTGDNQTAAMDWKGGS